MTKLPAIFRLLGWRAENIDSNESPVRPENAGDSKRKVINGQVIKY